MQELVMTPSTFIFLVAIMAGVFFAIRRLVKKGMCDCSDHCEEGCKGCSSKKATASASASKSDCSCCKAVDDMVSNMEKDLKL